MTTLRDGTVVDESIDAVNYTATKDVPAVFGNGPREILFIGIHHWGALGQIFDAIVRFLSGRNGRTNSAHAVIEAGRATSIVHPLNAAWAAGNAWANAKGIHLELRPEATDGDYITAAAYIFMLREEFGDVPLRPHRDFKQTACPGVWDLDRLDRMARAHAAPAPPAPAPPAPAPPAPAPREFDLSEIHWIVEPGDTLSKIAAYYNGPTVEQIAAYNNIDPDRIVPGQRVWIPGPLVWIIEAPDTIRSVAGYYGLDAGYLAGINGLPGPDATIYIGNRLTVKA